MTSKTILACLALIASVSMIESTFLPGLPGPNFGHFLSGASFINEKYGFGYVVSDIFGAWLNLAGTIVTDVLGFVKTILTGGSGSSKVPFVACPDNIQSLAGVLVNVGKIFGKVCAKSLGAEFDADVFADVQRAITAAFFAKLKLGAAGLAYLENAPTLVEIQPRSAKIIQILNKHKSGKWAPAVAIISDYLNVVYQKDITAESFAAATIKYLKVQAALLNMTGYPSTNEYISVMVETCNKVYKQIGYSGVIRPSDIVVNVQSNCL